jgi:hypothetical protein
LLQHNEQASKASIKLLSQSSSENPGRLLTTDEFLKSPIEGAHLLNHSIGLNSVALLKCAELFRTATKVRLILIQVFITICDF